MFVRVTYPRVFFLRQRASQEENLDAKTVMNRIVGYNEDHEHAANAIDNVQKPCPSYEEDPWGSSPRMASRSSCSSTFPEVPLPVLFSFSLSADLWRDVGKDVDTL